MLEIEAKGYLETDNIRKYYSDGKLSSRHLKTVKSTIKKLVDRGYLELKNDNYLFTKTGGNSWKVANRPKLQKIFIEKGFKLLIPGWDVFERK